MKTIIYTPYEALIKTNNQEVWLNKNENIVLEEDEKLISVYPTEKLSRYSFTIDLNEPTSTFYSMMKHDDKNLIFLLDGLIAQNVEVYSFSYQNKDSFVEIGKDQIVFKTDTHQKVIIPQTSFDNVKCGNFKHINYVYFQNKIKSFLLAYNTLTNKAKLFQADEIEINDDGVVLTTNKNNFYKKIVEEYFVDAQGLKVKSRTFSRKENYPNNFISYVFMNSLKIKDYQNAYNLLCYQLKEKLDIDILKTYFGDISYFYVIDPYTIFAISNGKNMIYEFSIDQNNITEITDNLN